MGSWCTWWSKILRFFKQLSNLPDSALRAQISRDKVHDARSDPSCGNWAAGVHKKYLSLGMQPPCVGQAGVRALDPVIFRQKMGDEYKRVWADLHVSPRMAPSAGAISCTYLRWLAKPGKIPEEPYFELLISLSRLRGLMQV